MENKQISFSESTYISIPKDEYLYLASLKEKDYDFEKRISEVKNKYEEDLAKFIHSKQFVVQDDKYNLGESNWHRYIINTYNAEEEVISWLKTKFNIQELLIADSPERDYIRTSNGRVFVDRQEFDTKDSEIIKVLRNDIKVLEKRNKVLERYFKIARKNLLFRYITSRIFWKYVLRGQ